MLPGHIGQRSVNEMSKKSGNCPRQIFMGGTAYLDSSADSLHVLFLQFKYKLAHILTFILLNLPTVQVRVFSKVKLDLNLYGIP